MLSLMISVLVVFLGVLASYTLKRIMIGPVLTLLFNIILESLYINSGNGIVLSSHSIILPTITLLITGVMLLIVKKPKWKQEEIL